MPLCHDTYYRHCISAVVELLPTVELTQEWYTVLLYSCVCRLTIISLSKYMRTYCSGAF